MFAMSTACAILSAGIARSDTFAGECWAPKTHRGWKHLWSLLCLLMYTFD